MADLSRRKWMAMAGTTGVAMAASGALSAVSAAIPVGQPPGNPFHETAMTRSVLEFGAKGDAKKDNTAAFQKALDAVHFAGGGSVIVPAGRYLFKGHLDLPAATALVGAYAGPPAGNFSPNSGKGSLLLPMEGRGKPDGPAFISVRGVNAVIRGLAIYYPEQLASAAAPAPYPWTIQNGRFPLGKTPLGEDGPSGLSVIDVNISNAYQGIDLTLAGRHYISRVFGRPILTGIYVDQCYDCGRIENVHFIASFWTDDKSPMDTWIQNHGTAFRFGRSDGQYVFNTFCFQYHTGYHFVQTPTGSCYGSFLGICADTAHHPVLVDSVENVVGLHITNGEFSAQVGKELQAMAVGPRNAGPVNMTNCAFWDNHRFGTIQGTGSVSLLGCHFFSWNRHEQGEPSILCDGPLVIINGCIWHSRFRHTGKEALIRITKHCAGAIITGNASQSHTAFIVEHPRSLPEARFQIHSNIALG